jgi:hypothetical protein
VANDAPGKLSQPRSQWEQLFAAVREQNDGVFPENEFRLAQLTILLDIREMLIVQNLIGNQTTALLAQAVGSPIEKRVGGSGLIVP